MELLLKVITALYKALLSLKLISELKSQSAKARKRPKQSRSRKQ